MKAFLHSFFSLCSGQRHLTLPCLILAAWSTLFISLDFSTDIPYRHDDANYLALAKGFSQGTGYLNIALPYSESMTTDPSAFPLLLTAYWRFIFPHVVVLKILLALLLVSGVLLSFLWLRHIIPATEAFLIALAFSSMPMFVLIGNSILSEILFVPVLYAGFFLGGTVYRGNSSKSLGWLALLCFVLLARIRVVGLCFFGVHIVFLLWKKDRVKACAGIVLLALWIFLERLCTPAQAANDGYGHAFINNFPLLTNTGAAVSLLVHTYRHNIWSFAGSMYANILFPWFYSFVAMNPVKRLVVLSLFVNGCVGFFLLWKSKPWMRPILAATILSLIPVFSWRTGTMFRYLFPFFPLLALVSVVPILELVPKRLSRPARSMPLLFLVCMVGNQAIASLSTGTFDPYLYGRKEFKLVHDFVNRQQQRPDIILSEHNFYTYLTTGVRSLDESSFETARACSSLTAAHTIWGISEGNRAWSRAVMPCGALALVQDSVPLYRSGPWELCAVRCRSTASEEPRSKLRGIFHP
jgi:hypothetical protein